MPYTIKRLPGEPILITTYHGKVTLEDIRAEIAERTQLRQSITGQTYIIVQVHDADASFGDIIRTVLDANQGKAGMSTDPTLTMLAAGKNPFLKLYVDAMAKTRKIPLFADLDNALIAVRLMIAQGKTEP